MHQYLNPDLLGEGVASHGVLAGEDGGFDAGAGVHLSQHGLDEGQDLLRLGASQAQVLQGEGQLRGAAGDTDRFFAWQGRQDLICGERGGVCYQCLKPSQPARLSTDKKGSGSVF